VTIDPTARILAIVAFMGIAATTGISLWEWNGLDTLGRTQALAADANHVYVVTDPVIYVLDHDGTLRDEVPVAALETGPLQADAAVRNGELLLADNDEGAVVACNLQSRRCTPAMRKEGVAANWFAWTLKMTVDQRGHLFVSDAGRSTVEEYAPDGAHLRTYEPQPALDFPLGVTTDEQQNLVVADSNGHRLVALSTGSGETAWSFSTRDAPVDKGRSRPVSVTRAADGRWWVLMNNMNVDAGNLVAFGPDGASPQRIPLRADASPGALLALGDQVLVSDFEQFELLAFAADGAPLGEFGDAAFHARFAANNAEKQQRIRTRYVAWGALAGFILMGLYAGLLDQKARTASGEPTPRTYRVADKRSADPFDLSDLVVPDRQGVLWIDPDPTVLHMLKQSFIVSSALAVLCAILIWPLFPALRYVVIITLTALVLFNVYSWRRIARLGIGIAGDRIHLRGPDGRTVEAPATAVRHSARRLRIDRTVVPFRPGTAWFFKQRLLEQHVFPLLATGMRSSDWTLIPAREWIMVAASLLLLLGVVVTHRFWLP
jgi:outer membrane protein assembly factor BamB